MEDEKETSGDMNENSADGADKDKKLAMNKELQQLAFINPGRLTVTAGFNPEFSNREKRKLSRLMDQQSGKSEARSLMKSKPKRQALHDEQGHLMDDGRDLCDCQDPECPGCHYPCPNCHSTKCGSLCRCSRKWSYDHVYVYNESTILR